jgi:hypothetical protein
MNDILFNIIVTPTAFAKLLVFFHQDFQLIINNLQNLCRDVAYLGATDTLNVLRHSPPDRDS